MVLTLGCELDRWMEKNARVNPPVSMEESNQVLPVGRVYFFWGGRGGGGGWEYIHIGGMNIDGFFACRRQHFIYFILSIVLYCRYIGTCTLLPTLPPTSCRYCEIEDFVLYVSH